MYNLKKNILKYVTIAYIKQKFFAFLKCQLQFILNTFYFKYIIIFRIWNFLRTVFLYNDLIQNCQENVNGNKVIIYSTAKHTFNKFK